MDFVEGAVAHRRLFGDGAGQMIARPSALQPGDYLTVVDATAGWGAMPSIFSAAAVR